MLHTKVSIKSADIFVAKLTVLAACNHNGPTSLKVILRSRDKINVPGDKFYNKIIKLYLPLL